MKIQNVKGGYDFLPKEQKIRNYINGVLKSTFEEYGYLPIETPILCYFDMLAGKYDENNDILNEIYKLKDGVVIDGVKVVPKRVKIKKRDEGRNHIVKKMFEAVGHPVAKLTRERLAFLDVKGLQSGDYRYLSMNEVKRLKALKK